jgi:N-carbamoyl-L-amino-acid hydrolase
MRPSLSPVDMRSRQWLAQRMREAGLEARVDGVGNVSGDSNRPGPALQFGDT